MASWYFVNRCYNADMIVVIICGGAGTRLWPISKPDYPKHLLKLLDDNSLLQNTIERVRDIAEDIYLVTETSHADELKRQVPEVPGDHIIVEPARRGTASCIAIALATIKARVNDDKVVAFLHADHQITDKASFCKTVQVATEASIAQGAITLVGLTPHYPATGFGYIKLGEELKNDLILPVYKVAEFVEKPDEATAQHYVKSNKYLWNLGLFVAPITTFEQAFHKHNRQLHKKYRDLTACLDDSNKAEACYLTFANEPIDTALIEKLDHVLVVPGQFDWTDVGSFRDLYEVMRDQSDVVSRGRVVALDCKNTLILSQTDQPVIALGLDDFVVVNTTNGILICPKNRAQDVKTGVERLSDLN